MRALQINSQGRLLGANVHWHKSPHFDERMGELPLSLVVIHNISLPAGEFGTGYVQSLFDATIDTSAHPTFESLKGLEVSSHFFIDRKGEIWQFVETEKRAWHAGKSIFMGHERCNDFSIGIEMEGSDFVPFEPIQYDALQSLLVAIVHRYPTVRFITGHSDIAPGRKTDPGPYFSMRKTLDDAFLNGQLQYWHYNETE